MKSNCCTYILSLFPVFNKEKIRNFESLDVEHSSYLYSTYILNHKEILDNIRDEVSYVFCFDSNDKNHLPEDFFSLKDEIYWLNELDNNPLVELEKNFFRNCENNLVIFLDSIGFAGKDILKTFNLLSIEDNSVVLGKTRNYNLSFFGFNKLESLNFEGLPADRRGFNIKNIDFDTMLTSISHHENFIHVLGNFMLIKNKEDFKILYDELSKKESYNYCSEKIHGRFTNLFIEYKDLLK